MKLYKIILLVALILPIWLTIVAIGGEQDGLAWKDSLNSELSKIEDKKIQVIEVAAKNIRAALPAFSDHLEVDTSQVRAQGYSPLFVRILDSKGQIKNQLTIQARLAVQVKTAVATNRLERGTIISPADLKSEWRDASFGSNDIISEKDLIGRSVRSAIASGETVLLSKTEVPNLVTRGDRVTVVILSNGLKISGVGIAEQSGGRGQSIKVVNPDSKKEIIGVIADPRVVEVRL